MNMQRMLINGANPEHPAIAGAISDRPPNLVGQRLKSDLIIGLGQGAANCAVGAPVFERVPKSRDCLLVASAHHVHEAMERDKARWPH